VWNRFSHRFVSSFVSVVNCRIEAAAAVVVEAEAAFCFLL
jgi:hypothetical protein